MPHHTQKGINMIDTIALLKECCPSKGDDELEVLSKEFEASFTSEDKSILECDETYIYDKAILFFMSKLRRGVTDVKSSESKFTDSFK